MERESAKPPKKTKEATNRQEPKNIAEWKKQVKKVGPLVEKFLQIEDPITAEQKNAQLLEFVHKLQNFSGQSGNNQIDLAQVRTILGNIFMQTITEAIPKDISVHKNLRTGKIIFRGNSRPDSSTLTPAQITFTILHNGLNDGSPKTILEILHKHRVNRMPDFQIFTRLLQNEQLRELIPPKCFLPENTQSEPIDYPLNESGRSPQLEAQIAAIKAKYELPT